MTREELEALPTAKLLNLVSELQHQFDAGSADGMGLMAIVVESLAACDILRKRGVSEERIVGAGTDHGQTARLQVIDGGIK